MVPDGGRTLLAVSVLTSLTGAHSLLVSETSVTNMSELLRLGTGGMIQI